MLLSPDPRLFLSEPKSCFLVSYCPSPTCTANLNLLASMTAKINTGVPILFWILPQPGPLPILVLKVVFFGKLLLKTNLCTKFEVVSFNGCSNKLRVSNFYMLPQSRPSLILALKVVFGKLLTVPKLCKKYFSTMCIYDDGNSVFRTKNICNAKFGDLGNNGNRGQNMSSKVPYLEQPTLISYLLCNFYGATMMIKGSLLLSAPLLSIFGRKFLGQNLTVLGDKQGFDIKFKFYDPRRHILA